jgi:anti-sigma regulatory factor (Ser/Thr protein kinase)
VGPHLRFAFVHGWVPTARFAVFVPIRLEPTTEGTPLHVFLLLRLPASPLAAGVARHAVAGLAPYLNKTVAENAELLVSELVTNSVRHAGLPGEASIEFSVRASAEVLMVEVADGGQGFDHGSAPRPRLAIGDPLDPSGWGLFLVEQIADRWGAVQTDGETRVWFELSPGAIVTDGYRAAAVG